MVDRVPPAGRHSPLLLSPREDEVLRMVARGLTNLQIATRLNLSVHAVKFHLAAIYRKFGVANRTEAAVLFLRSSAGQPGDRVESDKRVGTKQP